jgi:hypothetical protein
MVPARLLDDTRRDALRTAIAALDAAERACEPLALSHAYAALARWHAALPAPACAQAHFEAAWRWSRVAAAHDHTVDLLCALAEADVDLADMLDAEHPDRGQAARERARDRVFEAVELAPRVSDAHWERCVLLRLSDVLARCGDHADAVWLQGRAFGLVAEAHPGETGNSTLLPPTGRTQDA